MSFEGEKSVEELMVLRYFTPIRRNCDGSCCECGACCDRVLMLTAEEKKGIKDYIHTNPELKKKIGEIYKERPHRKCPFLDVTKKNHKCLIYNIPFYPIICKTYNCDESKMDPKKVISLYKASIPEQVDMWHYFLDDPVDITDAWRLKDQLENIGLIKVPPLAMLYPENLPNLFKIIR